jgi:hypothetical protein
MGVRVLALSPLLVFWVLVNVTISFPLTFFISPKKTSAEESMMLHSRPTEIAVSMLSPVAIIVRMLA